MFSQPTARLGGRILVSLVLGASWSSGAGCKVDGGSGKQDAASAKSADAVPSQPPAAAVEPSEAAKDDDPLGKRFVDPAWFRKDMIEGAKSVEFSRSETDENGLFSSRVLFEFPDGASAESCADTLTQEIEPSVQGLERTVEPDGRIKIEGKTERYTVTLLCGEVGDAVKAYVGYRWTS